MSHLADNILVFGRLLRTVGLDVHMGRMLDVLRALPLVDIGSRDEVYHTCRTLLVHRREELHAFDRAFEMFWRRHDVHAAMARIEDRRQHAPAGGAGAGLEMVGDAVGGDAPGGPMQTYSAASVLATKDFAEFTPDELAIARAALDRLTWNPGERRTRRWIRGEGPRIDMRRALAASIGTFGEVIKLPRRARRVRRRPIVLICDVSGSMERYSRMLLQFSHGLARRHVRVESFVFSTGLTRITSELRTKGPDAALAAAARAVPDWSGGTRIGDALRTLHQRWMRRVLHHGPVVVLISDGWDRGDPEVLSREIARLQRSCHRLIWLNPLLGTADYAPLTRGLQAALPYVDDFLPARTLTNLLDLSVHLNRIVSR